jgi:hypothetical protein
VKKETRIFINLILLSLAIIFIQVLKYFWLLDATDDIIDKVNSGISIGFFYGLIIAYCMNVISYNRKVKGDKNE